MAALLVLTSPFAAAAPIIGLHAPYLGATTFASNSTATSTLCLWAAGNQSISSVSVPPAAHPNNGNVVAKIVACAVATTKGGTWVSRTAYITSTEGFLVPGFTANSSRSYSVTYAWHVSWNLSGAFTGNLLTTKANVRFPLDEKIPVPLVKKLVKASLNVMRGS
ncbi:MAG: hypothetical protein L3J97_00065 [Thermoplasmata archaeon]|nr:hypothetical protein [Thermoplasmata archaeon]